MALPTHRGTILIHTHTLSRKKAWHYFALVDEYLNTRTHPAAGKKKEKTHGRIINSLCVLNVIKFL